MLKVILFDVYYYFSWFWGEYFKFGCVITLLNINFHIYIVNWVTICGNRELNDSYLIDELKVINTVQIFQYRKCFIFLTERIPKACVRYKNMMQLIYILTIDNDTMRQSWAQIMINHQIMKTIYHFNQRLLLSRHPIPSWLTSLYAYCFLSYVVHMFCLSIL